jgi:CO/xanthine dehydrogenase FAD-binding subunit
MDAQIEIEDKDGIKTLPLESIYTGDGIAPRNLSKTAIIKSIILPTNRDFKCDFRKLRPREAVDFTSLTAVVAIDNKGKVKIVVGGVDPKPIVIEGTSDDDKNELIKKAVKKARIVDNDVYSRGYRKEMITVYLKRSFKELESI